MAGFVFPSMSIWVAEVWMFGADHAHQPAQPGLLEVDVVIRHDGLRAGVTR